MRRMGRPRNESSPVNSLVKAHVASKPASIRIVEPLLPQSKAVVAARKLSRPRPRNLTCVPARVISTPSCRRQASVEAQSAPVEKLVMVVVPSARADSMAARWEIDLSPGSAGKTPRTRRAGSIFIICFKLRKRPAKHEIKQNSKIFGCPSPVSCLARAKNLGLGLCRVSKLLHPFYATP